MNSSSPNRKPGVLIIDGHVQALALTRSFGDQGIPVYIVDRNRYGIARYSKYCNKFFVSPDYLSPDFADYLLDLGKKEGLQDWLLLPCDDHIVFSISKRKQDLQQIYKVITVDFDILQNIINKRNLFSLAAANQLPVIKTFYPNTDKISMENIGGFRFPLLLKGIEGQTFYKKTNAKAFRANNIEELSNQLKAVAKMIAFDEVMVQEMIPLTDTNKVISFTAFCDKGEIKSHWMGQKIREHPIYFGTATCSQSINEPQLLQMATPLIKSLNYNGVCEIEFLQDPRDGEYYLIEINPRTWLWVGLAKACGIDYAMMMYNHMHHVPQTFPNTYEMGKYWKNEITDTIFTAIGLLKGKIPFRSLKKHFSKTKVKALYNRKDPKPFWVFLFLLPYIYIKR